MLLDLRRDFSSDECERIKELLENQVKQRGASAGEAGLTARRRLGNKNAKHP